ncbi:MAG: O-antigen ligase family protein [bacterium]
MNYLTAVLCGLALLVAQYFVGRGSYPFLPLPAYGVICLAALSSVWTMTRRNVVQPRWSCLVFVTALVGWIAIPLSMKSGLWLPGAVLRLVLAGWILYCLVVFVITGPEERLVLVSVLLVGAFAQAALGIFQSFFPDAHPYLGWISDLCPERMEGHAFRARGFYYNANHLAWGLNFAAAFALALGVWGRVGLWFRVLLLYSAAMFFGTEILTQSRGGLLGAAALVMVFLALSARGLLLGAWGRRGRMTGLIFSAVLVCLFAAWQAYESSDAAQYRALNAGNENYRAAVWKTAFRQWQTEPIAGAGVGTFTNFSRQFRFRPDALDDIFAHNDWVQALAETGLIGAGLWTCIGLLHLASGWRAFGVHIRKRLLAGTSPTSLRTALELGAMCSLSAFAVHSFFDFNMQIPANALLACVSLGILASPEQRTPLGGARVLGARLVSGAAIVSAVALGTLSWRSARAELSWIQADLALARRDSDVALKLADSGLSANPEHSGLMAAVGQAALVSGKQTSRPEQERKSLLERAAKMFSMASQREPADAWHMINLAHTFDNSGDFEKASPLHREAIAKAPFYTTPYEYYALHLELRGSREEALRFYDLALQLPDTTFASERREALLKTTK